MAPFLVVDTEKLSSLQWSFLPPMKTQREGGAAVAVGTEMVALMGGYHVEHKFLNSCSAFHAGSVEEFTRNVLQSHGLRRLQYRTQDCCCRWLSTRTNLS